jgi:hypothetical protein
MLPIILSIIAVLIVGLLVIVAMQSSEYRVSRSTTVSAPPEAVFEHVNDFHNWETWNPWGKLDPAMKVSYDGAPAGVGAVYSWVGNNQVGEGRMTIIESRSPEMLRIKLDFFKPMKGTSIAEFTFTPQGDQTNVTWSMVGEKNFVAKAFHLLIRVEKMIGGQFEKGLADLKKAAEQRRAAQLR